MKARQGRRRAGRVPRRLRPGHRGVAGPRLRRVAERAAPAARGERHQRHEVGDQRRPAAQRARRLVGRGLRRRERLGDLRRGRRRPSAPRTSATRTRSTSCSTTRCVPAFYDRDEHGLPAPGSPAIRASLKTLGPRFSATRMLSEYLSGPYRGLAGTGRQREGGAFGSASGRYKADGRRTTCAALTRHGLPRRPHEADGDRAGRPLGARRRHARPGSHGRQVEARIAASPELSALYERERRVVDALHQARAYRSRARAACAPGSRRRVPTARRRARRRIAYAGGLVGALAAVGAGARARAAVGHARRPVGVRRGGAGRPRSRSGGAGARPGRSRQPGCTRTSATSTSRTGPRASAGTPSGARTDKLGGRPGGHRLLPVEATQRIAYTIVSAPAAGRSRRRIAPGWDGTELRTLTLNGRLVVTLAPGGRHLRAVGTGVKAAELQKLAAWNRCPTAGR